MALTVNFGIIGIIVAATVAISIQAVRQWRENRFREEDARARAEASAKQDATERERRISDLVNRYAKDTLRIANEDGALAAGVLALRDWTEVRDFCNRAEVQANDAAPIPSVRRKRIRDERLSDYFMGLSKVPNRQTRPDLVDALIDELSV